MSFVLVVVGVFLGGIKLLCDLFYKREIILLGIDVFRWGVRLHIMTIYVSLLLLFGAYLLARISISSAMTDRREKRCWQVLAVLLLGLFLFKTRIAHRALFGLMNGSIYSIKQPVITFVVDVILIVGFIVYFRRFYTVLERAIRRRFLVAGILFVSGSLLVDTVSKLLWRSLDWARYNSSGKTLPYALISTIEEMIEMIGVIIFAFTLLVYLQEIRKRIVGVH